jgi:hypothetical protein
MRRLTLAAWALFIIDACGIFAITIVGANSADGQSRDLLLGLAEIAALPLAALFAILGLSTFYESRLGLWISLALGAAPLILWLGMMVAQGPA